MMLRELMTPTVSTVDHSETLKQAALLMRDLDVGLLPVQEDDQIVGILTDRDIAVRSTAKGNDPTTTRVGTVMSRGVVSAYDDEEADIAIQTMEQKQVRRLLVLNHENRCVGIVSLGDIALRTSDPVLTEELVEGVSRPLG